MRKLYTTFLLSLACMSSAWASVYEAEVSTAKELVDALQSYTKDEVHIKLLADIDMAEVPKYKPVSDFKGSITGYYEYTDSLNNTLTNYHSIKNLKTSLAEDMTDSKVSGITFLDGERGGYWRNNACFLCEDAVNCDFTDILIVNCHYKDSDFGGDLWADKTGLLTNTMDNCTVTDVGIMNSSVFSDGSEIGGITGVATNGCTFTGCLMDAFSFVYTTWHPNAYIGGLVGTSEDCKFVNCQNQGVVSASLQSDNLGGISGYSTRCSFEDCYNGGTVTQMTPNSYGAFRAAADRAYNALNLAAHSISAGLFKSYKSTVKTNVHVENYLQHPNSYLFEPSKPANYAAETSYGVSAAAMMAFAVVMTIYQVAQFIYDHNYPDEVGGITSAAYACTFDRCSNSGLIICRDAYCGGIVGYADTKGGTITKINNCINTGYIQGGEQTGGIVGYLKDSHATNCFNAGSVDCLKSTNGPIYGDTNAKGATITTCFAMVHGAKYEGNAIGGEGVIVKFSEEDVVGGRAAYEMNRIKGDDTFRQTVGEHRYPNFDGDVVKASDIRTDIDLTYRVTNAESFCTALMNQYAQIELQNDIDFNNNYFSLYRGSHKFHGTIDGKGHTIKKIKIEATDQDENFDEDIERRAIIQFAEGATFKNLTLDSLTVKRDLMIAGLVGNSKNSTYERIYIKNSEIYAENSFIGGLVYESDHDTFTRCTTDEKTSVSTHGFPSASPYAYAGGLVSQAKNSTFTDCVNSADVSGKMDVVGGIVAYDEGSTFTQCRNHGYIHHESWAIPDDDELGGIVAKAKNSKFYECINYGKLKCEDENGGGIVGLGTNVTILNCLNASKDLEYTENTCGGIIGYAENSMVANCVSMADLPGIGESTGMNLASGNNYRIQIKNDRSNRWEATVDEKTMASGLVCRWLNNGYENRKEGKTVWRQTLDGLSDYWHKDAMPYPEATGHFPVEITDLPYETIYFADHLVDFAKRVNAGDNYACAVLMADIDLSGIDNWTPIGNHENRFQGIFDGQGHTIHGMKVNINSNDVGAGLFGVTHMNAEIRNVIIADDCEVNNSGEAGAGGILGRFHIGWVWGNMIIENCGSSAKVSGKKHAGGIVGRISVDSGTDYGKNVKVYVNKCFNMGDIYASDSNSGLLIGYAQNSGYVTNCWSGGHLEKMNASNPYPYSSNNPTGEAEYFAGYDQKIYIENCKTTHKPGGPKMQQSGVYHFIEADALTSGKLTYFMNGYATEGDLDWYQKIGEDAHPMLVSRGGDIVYSYSDNKIERYTNDMSQSGFMYFGPIRISQDFGMALLDGNSTKSLKLNNEIPVGNAMLSRSFTANVPSTLVLPFSGEIDSESSAKFFGFSAMTYDEENNKYTAVMDEVEGGKFDAYTPYLALFAEDADSLVFGSVTLEPVAPAVTQYKDWYFIGNTDFKVLGLDDEESQYYYGYAGMEFDGFKLGEFARLGDGASIAPFRCYMRHIDSAGAPDSFDVITKKAPTRAIVIRSESRELPELPKKLDVILKGANGETGIATFDDETGEFRFEGWYDLNGNRVDENYSGVRVANGKKVIVK